MTLRKILLVLALLMPFTAWAQAFPNKPVRIIVPYAAGGEHDALGRAIAQRLSDKWKQPVIIDNRTGGGSVIGTEAVAKAEPDGYTILFTSVGFITNQLTGQKIPYDSSTFEPSMLVALVPLVLYVNPNVPARDFKDLVAFAKAKPGVLTFGSSGVGSSLHLAAELFAADAQTEITHVAYRGGAPAIIDLLAGHMMALWSTPSLMDEVRAGKLRALATASGTRLLSAPEVPTTAELGFPKIAAASWSGFLVQAKVPAAIKDQIYRDLREATLSAPLRAQILKYRYEPATMDQKQYAEFLNEELVKWGRVIKERKLKLD
jgi:tripartite-type tricarboxylate transporter receptor subunit TctC